MLYLCDFSYFSPGIQKYVGQPDLCTGICAAYSVKRPEEERFSVTFNVQFISVEWYITALISS